MNTYFTCYSSLESGDIIFLDNYPSLTEAQKRMKSAIKNHMADEEPNTAFKILDKIDFDLDVITNDEEFPEGIVYRVKKLDAKVYEKKVYYEPTTVVGYLKPVTRMNLIGKVSIKELYINGISSNGTAPCAPRKAPPKQAIGFMSELGDVLKSGVQLKSVRKRSSGRVRGQDDIINFIDKAL